MSAVIGILGGALLVAGGVGLAVFGLRQQQRTGVDRLRAAMDEVTDPTTREISVLAQAWTAMTAATERAGRGGSLHARATRALEGAGWPLRPAEFATGVAVASLLAALVATALAGSLATGLLVAVVAVVAPCLVLKRQARVVAQKADRQLPDVLGQMAASLRSGHSLTQAIEAAGEQADAPLGPQFARVIAETRVGRDLDDALSATAERIGSTDLRWSVRAMAIQARTGGKLSDVLEVLAEFMRDREEVRREVRALTADGRISAWVLGLLPFFVTGALLVISPDYLQPLFSERLGLLMLFAAGVLMGIGMLVIRKIIRVEV
ncbi:MAG TPA: type II secretion system F family protein [Egibacteraceae bacterium]|nr:type II secretion system F family protein [Egibacteraceae bacterium]